MLSYSMYESDNRVRRYAETLVRNGYEVDAIALKSSNSKPHESLNGVSIFRIQERIFNEKSQFDYFQRLLKFLIKSSITLSKLHIKTPYDLIHVHNIPDFLVLSAIIPKLMGSKIILDIHDICPELYANKFKEGKKKVFFKSLLALEKLSCWFSDHVIVSNHLWQNKILSRSINNGKCSVIMNYPNNNIFKKEKIQNRGMKNGKFVFIYPGTFNWHQGLDIAIKAFKNVLNEENNIEFHIYGDGPAKNDLLKFVNELGIENKVLFFEPKSLEEISLIISEADAGIVPKRADSFGNEAFSTKILEFMALGVPVIVSETAVDSYYFNDSVVKFFKAGDTEDLSRAMLQIIRDDEFRNRLVSNAYEFVKDYLWDKHENEYLNLVDSLISRKP